MSDLLVIIMVLSYGLAIGYAWGKAKSTINNMTATQVNVDNAKYIKLETPNSSIQDSRVNLMCNEVKYIYGNKADND